MGDFLQRIENTWLEKCLPVIIDEDASCAGTVYAASFWLLYCDYTKLGTPIFSVNDEAHPSAADPTSRWSPPEWRVNASDASEEMMELYLALSESMAGKSDTEWNELVEAHYEVMGSVCKQLTDSYHRSEKSSKNPEFIVCILEDREVPDVYNSLLLGSTTPERRSMARGLDEEFQ